jgi:hypothetical protein
MKRLILVALLAGLSSGCVARWVGKPVSRLEKQYGRPFSIQPDGDNRIYIYPDDLAGFGRMTFTVDRRGIIRSWCATPNVPGPFGGDVFGVSTDGMDGTDGGFGTITDSSGNTTTTPNRNLPRTRRGSGGLGSECR